MQAIHFKIYPLDRSLTKLWFVEYKHPTSGKYQKKYGNFKRCLTVRDKIAEAERIISELKIELEQTPSRTDPYPGLDIARLVQLKFEERSIYLKFKSISTYRTKVVEFVKWYRLYSHKPEVVAMGIGVAFIKFLKESKRSNTTINAYRCTLKTLFKGIKKPRHISGLCLQIHTLYINLKGDKLYCETIAVASVCFSRIHRLTISPYTFLYSR